MCKTRDGVRVGWHWYCEEEMHTELTSTLVYATGVDGADLAGLAGALLVVELGAPLVPVPLLDLRGWLDWEELDAALAAETLVATESIHLTTASGAGPSSAVRCKCSDG